MCSTESEAEKRGSAGGNQGQEPTPQKPQQPPSDDTSVIFSALTLSQAARQQGSRGQGSRIVLASDGTEDGWRVLDKKVNKYPGMRQFTAIGTGGADFTAAMVSAVSSVVGSVHCECVAERHSSQGKYVSATVGPVWVMNSDQVVAIFAAMKQDERLKWVI